MLCNLKFKLTLPTDLKNTMSNYNTPIIDRKIFFDNPLISGAKLSPNGKYITFIKPLDGTMNIWIKPIDAAFDNAYPITQDKTRPIRSYFWSRDSKYVLYVQDKGGDENFRVYAVDPDKCTKDNICDAIDLTPYEDIRAFIVSVPKKHEDRIFVGINDRDKAWHDYYAIDIATGKRTLILENKESLSGVSFDLDGNLRLASRSMADGGDEILKNTNKGFVKILESNLEESLNPIRFDKAGNVYFLSNVGDPDLAGLYSYNLDTDEMTFLESDPENEVDLENASFSSLTDEMIATIYVGDKKRIYWKNKSFETDYNYLKEKFPGSEISLTSTTKDEQLWIFYVNDDTDPGNAYLFDRTKKTIEFLYSPRPDLPSEHLVKMEAVRYNSLDGLSIPAYLTLPNTEKKTNLPAVLFVHGGPWARDYWGYNSYAQFLANRGYVVLQPNFRGSTGYGKKFLNAAINEWGQKMQDDLTAGARYLAQEGYADPKKIVIMGGSYGGYATLAGLTFTPDEYAAGVSIVGPSNLFTLLETIPPYWESARVMFHKRMGNPNTEEGRAQLKRQSPFFHAQNIKVPLLVAQGGNDPRVKKSESDQIVIAMRDLDLPVEYINFPDEGHGFAKPDNSMAFITVMEKFLAKHIGGRVQEDIPEKISTIIESVTVDINGLEMPAIVSDDIKNAALALPTKDTQTEKLNYQMNLDMQGQEMKFDIERNIEVDDDTISINDISRSPMGDMTDASVVHKENFKGLKRAIKQGPLEIDFEIAGNSISGKLSMQGQDQIIDLNFDNDFIMDGPGLDIYLSKLPLELDFQTGLRVFNSQGQKFQTYHFKVEGEEKVGLYNCYKCLLKSVDGPDKSQTLWIKTGDAAVLVQKESVIIEMGGAKMRMVLRDN